MHNASIHFPASSIVAPRAMAAPAGEAAHIAATDLGEAQLRDAFEPAFGHMHVMRNLVIPMYAGSAMPTARFDVALVCEAGVYLFEVRGWRNAVVYRKVQGCAQPRWFLRQQGQSAAREVKDPAWQCGRKTTHLRRLLPSGLRVQYFVLLPFEGVALEGAMPSAVLTPQDLPYIARVARNHGQSDPVYKAMDETSVDRTREMLVGLQGDLTLEDHLKNCRTRGPADAGRASRGGQHRVQ